MEPTDQFAPLRKGLLEMALLTLIGSGPVYAADILSRLEPTPFATQEGTLYPLLSKLRRDELVDYEWRESAAGPPRKYYQLTDKGRARLANLKAYWTSLTNTLEHLGRST
jgi:PadR family transcriptional regulator PadR